MRITPELAKKFREEALARYNQEQQEFVHQMIMMGCYKVKANLSENGLRKVLSTDSRREKDEAFNKEFSQILCQSVESAWTHLLGELMIEISAAYELKLGEDLGNEQQYDEDLKLDFFV